MYMHFLQNRVSDLDSGFNWTTGSKNHYIKMYNPLTYFQNTSIKVVEK